MEIDHDDSHAFGSTYSYALLLHGAQKPGTESNIAWKLLKAQGLGNYNESKKAIRMEKPIHVYVTKL